MNKLTLHPIPQDRLITLLMLALIGFAIFLAIFAVPSAVDVRGHPIVQPPNAVACATRFSASGVCHLSTGR